MSACFSIDMPDGIYGGDELLYPKLYKSIIKCYTV